MNGEPQQPHGHQFGFTARIVRFFIDSKLTPLVIVAAVMLGAGAVLLLPREEEPQIIVPMIDVFVRMPGASAQEVAERVTTPMEKLLWEIPGVEYIYSTSSPGQAMAVVRFYVGQKEEDAIVRLNQKMSANFDLIPPGCSPPLIKPRRIDDVPILALTLHGAAYDHYTLRRIAAQLDDQIKQVANVSATTLIGGQRRQLRVLLDPARLAAAQIDLLRVTRQVQAANQQSRAGSFSAGNREVLVETGGFLPDAAAVAAVVVGVHQGKPVYLRDVADIVDGPEEVSQYVLFGAGAATPAPRESESPAVTIAIAKRKGANAIWVADAVLGKLAGLKGRLIPNDVTVTVTRNYGLTAAEKSNELLVHMAIAVIGVTFLIGLVLGWRESGVVAVAIPVTLALTLATFYFLGFTLNRITLFALIFSIGILVDDPIVDVENIVRHFRLPQNKGRPLLIVTLEAVNEVRSPLILATLTVIAAILPMAFVSGLMGPYMRPIPIGASAAMVFSMAVAFVVTPWAAYRILRRKKGEKEHEQEQERKGQGEHGENEDAVRRGSPDPAVQADRRSPAGPGDLRSVGVRGQETCAQQEGQKGQGEHGEKEDAVRRGSPDPAVQADRRSPAGPGDLRSVGVRGQETCAQQEGQKGQGEHGEKEDAVRRGSPDPAVQADRRSPAEPGDLRSGGVRGQETCAQQEGQGKHGEREDWTTRLYRHVMGPLIHHPWWQAGFLAAMTLLLLGAASLVYIKAVKVKMLPFDNKSEFQVIVDMDEGTTLEQTARVTRELAAAIRGEPEVTDYQVYVGTAAPYNFNGLVRHYYLRHGPNVADIQVNLLPKNERKAQSHQIAKRIRPRLQAIAARYGARVKLAEVPPGPPVLQTLVAEIYGPDYSQQIATARQVLGIFQHTPGVVDADWYMEAAQPELVFRIDHEKAALHGITADQIAQTLRIAQEGFEAGLLHLPREKEDVAIELRLPVARRSATSELLALPVAGSGGALVPLGELVKIEETVADHSIYHKNLMPVVYVTADVAGAEESPVYAILKLNKAIESLDVGPPAAHGDKPQRLEILTTHQPLTTETPSMKWDGEWHITFEVFRDLGAAFAVVLVLIYVLVVGWFRSFKTPFIIMAAIPFSLVGILPAHWALGAFFTATSMIGFIAGAGIVVRNSIILVDFIELRVAQGMPLAEAVIDAGAVRFRPMMLTAAAVVVGASVILFDPIFQGLAISLMAGEIASLFLSRMAVPVIYYLAMRRQHPAAPVTA